MQVIERLSFSLTLLWLSLSTLVLADASARNSCPARRHPPGSSPAGKTVYAFTASNGTSYISLDAGAEVTASASTSTQKPCFPALDFQMPSQLPADNSGWWCDDSTEYAFLGFSYEVSQCAFLPRVYFFLHFLIAWQVKAFPSSAKSLRTSANASRGAMCVFMELATHQASSEQYPHLLGAGINVFLLATTSLTRRMKTPLVSMLSSGYVLA
jgi:hypothetical protein